MPIPAGQRSGRCKICQHPERFRIELALVSGVGRRALARKFAVSGDAIWRHGRAHMSEEQRTQLLAGPVKLREMADRAAEEGLSLLEYISMVRSAVLRAFFAAGEANDRGGVALLAGRLSELFRLQGQFSGQLAGAASTVTNNTLILSSPIMADVEQVLLERLRPFPDAAHAVFEGLEQLRAMRLGRGALSRPALEHAESAAERDGNAGGPSAEAPTEGRAA
jgi:hypothetical protein